MEERVGGGLGVCASRRAGRWLGLRRMGGVRERAATRWLAGVAGVVAGRVQRGRWWCLEASLAGGHVGRLGDALGGAEAEAARRVAWSLAARLLRGSCGVAVTWGGDARGARSGKLSDAGAEEFRGEQVRAR
jgi:hypothetical protein